MRRQRTAKITILLVVSAIALGMAASATLHEPPELVSIQEAPDSGEMCAWEPIRPQLALAEDNNLFAAFGDKPVFAAQDVAGTTDIARPPVRNILDTDPIYSAVTVDTRLDEVYLQDPNTWSIRVFGRLDNTPPDAPRTEPRRVIGGPKTDVQFNSCVYVDPKNGDI